MKYPQIKGKKIPRNFKTVKKISFGVTLRVQKFLIFFHLKRTLIIIQCFVSESINALCVHSVKFYFPNTAQVTD